MAVQVLAAAGYEARNYVGSWHEWSRDPSLPAALLGGSERPRGQPAAASRKARQSAAPCSFQAGSLRPVSASTSARGLGRLCLALGEPPLEHVPLDLRMELDTPRPVAEPERLPGGRARGELDGVLRELERVVVPLERLDAARDGAEHRVGRALVVDLDGDPADLRSRAGPTQAPRARAISCEPRQTPIVGTLVDGLADEPDLVRQPRVLRILVGVHGAAEDHDRVPLGRVAGRRVAVHHDPAFELVPLVGRDSLEEPATPVASGSWTTERTRMAATVAGQICRRHGLVVEARAAAVVVGTPSTGRELRLLRLRYDSRVVPVVTHVSAHQVACGAPLAITSRSSSPMS